MDKSIRSVILFSVNTPLLFVLISPPQVGGRVVRRCWVNFQCRGVLLIWIIVGQGHTLLAVGAGGGCLDIFSLVYQFSLLSPSLWETARYRLKYCLKGPLSPKLPTNQISPLQRWCAILLRAAVLDVQLHCRPLTNFLLGSA